MKFHIYINYLDVSEEVHSGVYYDDFVVFVRNVKPGHSYKIRAFIDLNLSSTSPKTWETIDTLVDQAFMEIGIPVPQQEYFVEKPSGTFGFLTRPDFPQDAASVKAALREEWERIKDEGIKKQMRG